MKEHLQIQAYDVELEIEGIGSPAQDWLAPEMQPDMTQFRYMQVGGDKPTIRKARGYAYTRM